MDIPMMDILMMDIWQMTDDWLMTDIQQMVDIHWMPDISDIRMTIASSLYLAGIVLPERWMGFGTCYRARDRMWDGMSVKWTWKSCRQKGIRQISAGKNMFFWAKTQ